MANFDLAIDFVLKHEGGYVDHKDDPGGATNRGITFKEFVEHHLDIDGDGDIDKDDVKLLPVNVAKDIYRSDYWTPVMQNLSSQKIATKLFDMTVNMGASQANKILQRALNSLLVNLVLDVDGSLGPKSISTMESVLTSTGEDALLGQICVQQANFYTSLVERKPNMSVFLKGWLNRANDKP